jgi:tyrosyl-tRNA synthetase
LLTRDQVNANVDCIKQQLAHFLDFESKTNPARVLQ